VVVKCLRQLMQRMLGDQDGQLPQRWKYSGSFKTSTTEWTYH